ncbi:MAG: tetratricopeptide repeat protein [Planctomycetota bacterium]
MARRRGATAVSRAAKSRALAAASLIVAVCSVASCDDAAPPPPAIGVTDGAVVARDPYGALPDTVLGYPVTRGAAAGYVPDAACRDCHESIYDSYQATGMARSFGRLDPAQAVEDFGKTYHQEATGFYYEMHARGDKVVQRRYCKDERGRHFAEHEAEVAWVVGSGNHARTYFAQDPHGEMFELPLSWYAQDGWAMSPGYEYPDHERFERQVVRECMFCHNAYPEVPVGSDLPGQPSTFPTTLPHGIGCQRCHGPGARHVESAIDPDADEGQVTGRIVNPAHFAPADRDNVCLTCHLQPDVFSGGESIVAVMDRPVYAHRPDLPVTDAKVFFDFGTAEERAAKIEINHHAYRLRQSACYTASDGALHCVTCHDPHTKRARPEHADHYAKACLQCHATEDCNGHEGARAAAGSAALPDCVACHMHEARPRDVIHATITDHRIRRRPPKTDLTARRPPQPRPKAPLQPVPYLPDQTPTGALRHLYAGWASEDRASPEQLRAWRAALAELQPSVSLPYVTLGRALALAGDVQAAVEVLSAAASRFADDALVHYTLGLALHIGGEHAAAMQHVDQALAAGEEPLALALKGNLHALLRQLEPAREACEASLRLRPNRTKTWKAYASILAELGQLDRSAEAYRNVIARSPDELEAYFMLADIHRAQGRPAEMVRILEHGASRSDDVRLELVVVHLLDGPPARDTARALAIARDVRSRQPASGRAHAYLAFAMIVSGQADGVGAVLDAARAAGADPAVCTGLAALERRRVGDRPGANGLLERFQVELRAPSSERLRGPIVRLLRATSSPR